MSSQGQIEERAGATIPLEEATATAAVPDEAAVAGDAAGVGPLARQPRLQRRRSMMR